MNSDAERLFQALSDAVVNMDEEAAARLSRQALDIGVDANLVLSNGLIKGMEVVGSKYDSGEYFVSELLLSSDALYAGLSALKPHLAASSSNNSGTVVIGVMEGDTHDIGKNIVKIMLEGAGFQVSDLGFDVPHIRFIDAAIELNADIIALSTLMTAAMEGMQMVVSSLVQRGQRDRFKVVIGGAPTSAAFAKRIGADGYAPDATGAVRVVKSLAAAGKKERAKI